MSLRNSISRSLAVFAALAMALLGSGCVYFNTYYNAQKAYNDAMRLHDKRMAKNPEDTLLVSPDEKIKLDRCITKSSMILELYQDKPKYLPKALFLIGESYLAMGENAKAIEKYEELEHYYPQAPQIPIAESHRARCLFLNGQYPAAQVALEAIIAGNSDPEIKAEAMIYLAQLNVKSNGSDAALDLYEKLLKEQTRTPLARANVHLEAAKLAFTLKEWERARAHALAPEMKELPTKLKYRADMLAAECLYRMGKPDDGLKALDRIAHNRLYGTYLPEIQLKLAEGYFLVNKPGKAIELLNGITKIAPKSAYSAEAFYRLGEHQLRVLKDEKQAKIFYDSAAAAGMQFEYGALAAERSSALGKLVEFRKSPDTTASQTHYRDFMMAELFLFRVDDMDSAVKHLDRIIHDPRQDSIHSLRAAYARAFIEEEFRHSKTTGDSMYRYVMEKYPRTEYAKQAERNLGLKPTVQTDEDLAHQGFLAAEALRFGGGDLMHSVIPAYGQVVKDYPQTHDAAKAQFTMAMLYEGLFQGEEKVAGAKDSAIAAFTKIREDYSRTSYFARADAKLNAAGIRPKPKVAPVVTKPIASGPQAVSPGGTSSPSSGAGTPASNPSASSATPPAGAPPSSPTENHYGHGQMPPPTETTPAVDTSNHVVADTANIQPEGKTKEVIDNGYENVEQY